MKPRVLILYANGTNRNLEMAFAFELAGATADIMPLKQLRQQKKSWQDYQILGIPGGFSYADTLGAGKLFALEIEHYFSDKIQAFIDSGKPVIGICNGFQVLTKLGVFLDPAEKKNESALTCNTNGQFECRWVTLLPQSQTCLWTKDLVEPIECPVAHGEGRLLVENKIVQQLEKNDQIALRYALPNKVPAKQIYPFNPNGSVNDIAGLCNAQGNVLGLMPHPENHILLQQHPRWTRNEKTYTGLTIFKNGVCFC